MKDGGNSQWSIAWRCCASQANCEFRGAEEAEATAGTQALGAAHRQQTGIMLNWTGTNENVAHHLLHRRELEQQWPRVGGVAQIGLPALRKP